MPKTIRKTSLKIQMLAGNSLNVCPDSDSQKKLPLVTTIVFAIFYQFLSAVSIQINKNLDFNIFYLSPEAKTSPKNVKYF